MTSALDYFPNGPGPSGPFRAQHPLPALHVRPFCDNGRGAVVELEICPENLEGEAMRKIGVILHNLGGPTSLDAIRPFLTNLFLDPEIIRIPLPGLLGKLFPRRLFAEFVARRRTPQVRPNYEMIGGKSPLLERTIEQARALEAELNRRFAGSAEFTVRLGMRYWHPFTSETVDELRNEGVRELFLLPLYPQYSRTTTGSSFKEWRDLHRGRYARSFRVKSAKDYHLHRRYIDAINDRIDATLRDRFTEEERRGLHLLFSAHGTPIADVEAGDPYSKQIAATVEAVMRARGNDYPHHLSFQSRVGPVKWLEPYTQDMLARLGSEGVKSLLVVPVAFVTDHIETLHELDIELRHVAQEAGIRKYEVMFALNDSPTFIAALADVIEMRYAGEIDRNHQSGISSVDQTR